MRLGLRAESHSICQNSGVGSSLEILHSHRQRTSSWSKSWVSLGKLMMSMKLWLSDMPMGVIDLLQEC